MQDWPTAISRLAPGSRIVIRKRSGADLAAILLACLDQRLVGVPLDPRLDDAELERVCRTVSAAAVITEDAVVTPEIAADPEDDRTSPELALMLFTSGSTGVSKGVMLPRDAVLGNSAKTAALHGISPQRPHGTCLPLYHCNAIVMSLIGSRLTGAPLVRCDRFDPAAYFAQLAAAGATTASIVPALLWHLLEHRPEWPETLEYLITAAAPLSQDLAKRFYECYGPRLRQGYGLTEAVNFSFTTPLLDGADFVEQYIDNVAPVGLPLEGTEFHLDDGEVVVRSPDMMAGYWRDASATAAVLSPDGWLRTGDLGTVRDGFLVLKGRRGEVINRGGEKYYPLDLERRWKDRMPAGPFAAVPVAEHSLGQEFGLFIEAEEIERVEPVLAGEGLRPAAVQSGRFDATSTGKPQRRKMGRQLAVRRDSGPRYAELFAYAHDAAAAILADRAEPLTDRAKSIHARAAELLAARRPASADARFERVAAHDSLDLLVGNWPAVAQGLMDGPELMRGRPGLWKRLMTEWPMGSYATLMADTLRTLADAHGRFLELGTGVGNTTSLVGDLIRGEFVWSDASESLVRRGSWPGAGLVYDFDREPPGELGTFDTIFATNAVHCAQDKLATLRHLRDHLADGGRVVLCEGSPRTGPDTPWALDFLFALFDGWWDRGGFLSRWEWVALLRAAGYRQLGFSVLRAGPHDLGGAVWGAR
ncbi:AMP-binding protein [Dactylosporangium sp. NPDC051541]|uniref:AMP-binding protein n=1 Tax=Dactylosporangium sp. NPDC051541 TaxID=3363977 RepID=UPI003794A541